MGFFCAVNLTFFPIHFAGLQGCPRKYKEIAKKYKHLMKISTIGATMGVIRMFTFMSMFV